MKTQTRIFKPQDELLHTELAALLDQVISEIKAGKNVIVTIDVGEPCPKCGGISVDCGDSFRKQYGKTYRTCIDCMHTWPEGGKNGS